jgi:hypothetical protein
MDKWIRGLNKAQQRNMERGYVSNIKRAMVGVMSRI